MRLFRRSVVYYRILMVLFFTEKGWCFLVGHTRSYGGRRHWPSSWQRVRNHQDNEDVLNKIGKVTLLKTKTISRDEKPSADEALLEDRSHLYRDRVQECNTDYNRRMDCGYFGINQRECYQRGCCWEETTNPDVPWCYHSKSTIGNACLLEKSERQKCGWYGIKKEHCLAMNCCWQPTDDNSIPWCFQALNKPVYEGECGIPVRPPSTYRRIVGGMEAEAHSWPWMVSLQIDDTHFCGGTLLNDQWVISAAHCERGFSLGTRRTVVLGEHDLTYRDNSNIRRDVIKIIPHADYSGSINVENDIMLIKLKRPVQLSDHVTPVCLPEEGQRLNPGKHCYRTGWGNIGARGSSTNKLQQVMIPIISSYVCRDKQWYGGRFEEMMLCAGYEEGDRDVCQGDSGDPLVCNIDGIWRLFGIVSWGERCARGRKPGVYSKVSYYVDWIETTINNNSK